MAAEQMGVTTGGNKVEYIGTTAEKADMDSAAKQIALFGAEFGAGSNYWDTDLNKGFVWSHSAWKSVTA